MPPITGAEPAQLHQGSGGLCVAGELKLLLPYDAGVPQPVRHTQQPRGQTTGRSERTHGRYTSSCNALMYMQHTTTSHLECCQHTSSIFYLATI